MWDKEQTAIESLGKTLGGRFGGYLKRDIASIRDYYIGNRSDASLLRRRKVVLISLTGLGNAGIMILHQTGILRRLPDLPLPGLDANAVTSSKKAFEFSMPDSPLAASLYSLIMVFATYGGNRQLKRARWVDGLLLGSVLVNAAAGIQYFLNMAFKQKKICLYCVTAALINVSMTPFAWKEWKEIEG
jgi:uncharacterized membrane protein